jgi:hypothetical protein
VPVREPVLRRVRGRRRRAPAQAPAAPGAAQAGRPRCRAGRILDVLPGLRVLQRRVAQLAHAVHLRLPGRRRAAAGRVRLVADPRGQPAAAAPDRPGPQPRRLLPGDTDPGRRDLRHLLVPHLLHAADPGVLPGGDRRR